MRFTFLSHFPNAFITARCIFLSLHTTTNHQQQPLHDPAETQIQNSVPTTHQRALLARESDSDRTHPHTTAGRAVPHGQDQGIAGWSIMCTNSIERVLYSPTMCMLNAVPFHFLFLSTELTYTRTHNYYHTPHVFVCDLYK